MSKTKIKRADGVYYRIDCAYCEKPIEFKHGEASSLHNKCPNCGIISPYILKPKTERILFELQEKLYENYDSELASEFSIASKAVKHDLEAIDKDLLARHLRINFPKRILDQMFPLLLDYVGSLLKKRIKRQGFYLAKEELVDKIHETVFIWYQEATRRTNFKIDDSWGGFLNHKITQALYANAKDEVHYSLDFMISDGKNGKENSILEIFDNDTNTFDSLKEEFYDPYASTFHIGEEIGKLLKDILRIIRKNKDKGSILYGLLGLKVLVLNLRGQQEKKMKLINTFGSQVTVTHQKIEKMLRDKLKIMLDIYPTPKEEEEEDSEYDTNKHISQFKKSEGILNG